MKKTFLLFIAALLPLLSTAQCRFALKGGLNVADADAFGTDDIFEPGSYTGFYVGPMLDFGDASLWGLNVGCLYSHSGMRLSRTADVVSLDAIQFPLFVSHKLLWWENFSLLVEVGPQFSYNLGEKRREIDHGTLNFAGSSLSLNAGLSVEFFRRVRLGLNYNNPIGPTARYTWTDTPGILLDAVKCKVRTMQFSATVLF